jgi:hypothetical protein
MADWPTKPMRVTQPPPNASRSPQETAWLEHLARIVNALSSSGKTAERPTPTTADRPGFFLYPGRPCFDTSLGTHEKPIWRNADNSGWVDATGSAV